MKQFGHKGETEDKEINLQKTLIRYSVSYFFIDKFSPVEQDI